MKEKEVLKRLGFEDRKSLNEIEQFQDYDLQYVEENKNYFNISIKKTKTSEKKHKNAEKVIENFLAYHQVILPVCHYNYGRVIITGWRGCLLHKLKEHPRKDFSHDESWLNKRAKTNKGKKSDNIDYLMFKVLASKYEKDESKKDKSKESSSTEQNITLSSKYNMDVGHVFGKFTGLTSLIEEILGSNQQVDNTNVYPQFKYANELPKDSDKLHKNKNCSQAYFESEAENHMPCYYEAEAICADWNDVVPIGTRIRIIDINTFNELYHVFVPNCDYDEDNEERPLDSENIGDRKKSDSGSKDTVDKVNSTSEPDISAEQYRAFFKEGDLNKLTPKNK